MSARISGPRGIKSSGITVENEPIILSDGVGAVTQWDNSTQGAGEGIYFVEGGSAGDPLRLGVGVAAPGNPLQVEKASAETSISNAQNEGGVLVFDVCCWLLIESQLFHVHLAIISRIERLIV